MSVSFQSLHDGIWFRYSEIKACGANKPGGGGFTAGNTCARGGGSKSSDFSIEEQTKPEWGPYRVRYSLKDKSGGEVGHLSMVEYPDHYRVTSSFIDDSARGKGHGKELYQRAIEKARNDGKTEFRSDNATSSDAAKIWEKLGAKKEKTSSGEQYVLKLKRD